MLAAGYPSQPNAEANGVPGMWAANYLNAAINAGIVWGSARAERESGIQPAGLLVGGAAGVIAAVAGSAGGAGRGGSSSSEMKTSDLNKAINRNTIASITAKALKLTAASMMSLRASALVTEPLGLKVPSG